MQKEETICRKSIELEVKWVDWDSRGTVESSNAATPRASRGISPVSMLSDASYAIGENADCEKLRLPGATVNVHAEDNEADLFYSLRTLMETYRDALTRERQCSEALRSRLQLVERTKERGVCRCRPQLQRCVTQLDAFNEQTRVLESRLLAACSAMHTARVRVQEAENDCAKLRGQLSDSELQVQQLQKQLEETSCQLQVLAKQHDSAQQDALNRSLECVQLREQLLAYQSNYDTVMTQVNTYKRDYDSVHSQLLSNYERIEAELNSYKSAYHSLLNSTPQLANRLDCIAAETQHSADGSFAQSDSELVSCKKTECTRCAELCEEVATLRNRNTIQTAQLDVSVQSVVCETKCVSSDTDTLFSKHVAATCDAACLALAQCESRDTQTLHVATQSLSCATTLQTNTVLSQTETEPSKSVSSAINISSIILDCFYSEQRCYWVTFFRP